LVARVTQSGFSEHLRDLEPKFFLVFAALCTLVSAQKFFDARQSMLRMSETARHALDDSNPIRQLPPVIWSAPLDDVFIHFDFARSLAHGHFFQWSPGGGYSSGATSWLYPALLSVAYRMGCTDFALGFFADLLAVIAVYGGLLALRRAFAQYHWSLHYLITATLCFQGLLAFAFWSGMEFALFFCLWCCAHATYQRVISEQQPGQQPKRAAWILGGFGLLLAATRPESLVCLLVWTWFATRRSLIAGWRAKVLLAARILGPCCLYLITRALLNRWLTGEFADAGSIAKLEFLAPYSTVWDSLWAWTKNLGFQIGRITAYHAGQHVLLGCLLWIPLVASLFLRRTRMDAQVLVASALGWMLLVASNEYVRYQNDRYTMAPLGWVLIAAVLAVHELARASLGFTQERDTTRRKLVYGSVAAIALITGAVNQAPRFRQQAWLFARASKNIAEQQVRLGLLLGSDATPVTASLLLGDAGALEYFSQLPGIDAFGLGTTRGLPFAKAVRLGNGATVELLQRLPPQDRPSLMALYPSWWKDLPLWFGHRLLDVDIAGNLMCGASNNVLYQANWSALDTGNLPESLEPGWHVADELDVADLVSEPAHDFQLSRRQTGFVYMKLLPQRQDPSHDLFDAGRILFNGDNLRFELSQLAPRRPVRLLLRAAPHAPMRCRVISTGHDRGVVSFAVADSWVEAWLDIDSNPTADHMEFKVQAEGSECNLFHIWAIQPD
jgi:hypothetical protein